MLCPLGHRSGKHSAYFQSCSKAAFTATWSVLTFLIAGNLQSSKITWIAYGWFAKPSTFGSLFEHKNWCFKAFELIAAHWLHNGGYGRHCWHEGAQFATNRVRIFAYISDSFLRSWEHAERGTRMKGKVDLKKRFQPPIQSDNVVPMVPFELKNSNCTVSSQGSGLIRSKVLCASRLS